MTIWADADSLPSVVRELLTRRASRPVSQAEGSDPTPKLRVVFVANRPIPTTSVVEMVVLKDAGPDGVDDAIFDRAKPGDLVVTRDIPFAERLLEAGIAVINDRGDSWNLDTVRERRSRRDFMADLRATGLAEMSQARNYGPRERKAFADALDRQLTRLLPKRLEQPNR